MKEDSDQYSVSRVPAASRSSLMTVTLVRVGAMTSLSQFMLGASLGHSMTFYDALWATTLGSLILEFVSLGLGFAGQREGLSTSLLARWTGFGRWGSGIIGLAFGVCLLGWFGVQNAVFAKGLDHAFGGALGFQMAAVLCGASITSIVAFGFKGLSLTARFSVPLFFLVVAWSAWQVLGTHSLISLMETTPNGIPMTIAAGATAVAGGYIAGALITPDLSRFCKQQKDVVWMTLISVVIGEFVVNTLAVLIANALNTDDVLTILTQTSGWIGFVTVILSTIKINDLNLYSSALGVANSIHAINGVQISQTALVVVMGVIGTLASVMGIMDHFIGFLIFLGVVFPPIAGVMLIDYFIVKSGRAELDSTVNVSGLPPQSKGNGALAILSCVVGAVAGTYISVGIPSVNALFSAAIFYLISAKLFSKAQTAEGVIL